MHQDQILVAHHLGQLLRFAAYFLGWLERLRESRKVSVFYCQSVKYMLNSLDSSWCEILTSSFMFLLQFKFMFFSFDCKFTTGERVSSKWNCCPCTKQTIIAGYNF